MKEGDTLLPKPQTLSPLSLPTLPQVPWCKCSVASCLHTFSVLARSFLPVDSVDCLQAHFLLKVFLSRAAQSLSFVALRAVCRGLGLPTLQLSHSNKVDTTDTKTRL